MSEDRIQCIKNYLGVGGYLPGTATDIEFLLNEISRLETELEKVYDETEQTYIVSPASQDEECPF